MDPNRLMRWVYTRWGIIQYKSLKFILRFKLVIHPNSIYIYIYIYIWINKFINKLNDKKTSVSGTLGEDIVKVDGTTLDSRMKILFVN